MGQQEVDRDRWGLLTASHRMNRLLLFAAVLGGICLLSHRSRAELAPSPGDVPSFRHEPDQSILETIRRVPREHRPIFAFNTTGPALRSGECKVFPGDAAWPSQEEWDALDAVLGGALIKSVPIAAPCYHDWGTYNAEECRALRGNWTNPDTHAQHPTSVMWPVWQGTTCLPAEKGAPESTCSLGGYPAYAVNATSVAQIQAAVNFARNKGVRLVVKNTGHDYMGKSVGAGALSIWTHHLTRIEYIAEYASGDFRGKALVAGSGVRTFDLARAAHENGASLVGGQCATVGFAGGYFSGGGLSPLSGLYGMAADHVLAIQIVTPDGLHRTVTAESHPDLFWAIRGGGASTWGVVTSVTVRLHPRHPLTSSWISFQTSAAVSKDTFWKGVRAYAEHFERFADAGFYGFTNIRRKHAGYNGSDFSLGIEPMLAPNMSIEAFDQVTRPFFDQLAALGIPFQAELRYFDSFHEGWAEIWPSDILVVAEPLDTPGSRLFPREVWTDPEGLAAILDTFRSISELGHDVTGFLISPRNPFNVDNAVSPALRHALGYFSSAVKFPSDATSEHKAAAQEELMRNILTPWREVAPSSKFGGSYLNEANPMEPFWQDDLYGDNYPRLLDIKRKYDPNGLFYAVTAVGSEDWEVRSPEQGFRTQNGRLCRV